jgi:hypothetical protein
LLLNIGGDLAVWGRTCDVAIADPADARDHAAPLTRIAVRNAAVATSGWYARGPHLVDARTGRPSRRRTSATVVARDAVTANALATTLGIVDADEGLALVRATAGAEAIRIESGVVTRSPGFARLELQTDQPAAASAWPVGFEVTISLTLTTPDPRMDRSYAAFWVEDASGRLVRTIVLWGNKPQYHPDMPEFWKVTGGDTKLIYKVTRATRSPGSYRVVWNGLDDAGRPAPRGRYRIVVEINRWRGTYARATGLLACEDVPSSLTLEGSVNSSAITVQYGPRPAQG